MATAIVRRYWSRVAALGCCICRRPAEIAHAHGGSLLEVGIWRAKGKKPSDWLVLPLCPEHHRVEYHGLDDSPRVWEAKHGPQIGWLAWLKTQTGVDAVALARAELRHASGVGTSNPATGSSADCR